MTLWSRLCCVGYGIEARWDALGHYFRGHNVKWWCDPDPWVGCLGHICCHECPDTAIEDGKHVGISFWCRHSQWRAMLAQRVCGLVGHPVFQHPKQCDKYLTDEIYCYRCGAGSKLRKEWINESEL